MPQDLAQTRREGSGIVISDSATDVIRRFPEVVPMTFAVAAPAVISS
jgi:hypothetical protein